MGDDLSLEELYEDAPCGYLSLGPDGVVTRVNRTLLRSTGFTADDLVGRRRLLDLLAPGSRLYAETHWAPRLELEGELREMPVDLVRADGSQLPVLLNATTLRRPDGSDGGLRASLFDATDRRRYERELIAARDHERAARQRVERLQRLSAALSAAIGVDRVAEALLDGVFDAVAPDGAGVVVGDTVVAQRRERPAVLGAVPALELPLTVADRRIGLLAVDLGPGRRLDADEQTLLTACAASGATALRRASLFAQMQHQALHDALTGLPNRLLLRERVEHEIARARRAGGRFAVALLGLDGFKLVNDTRGYAAGDRVLCEVARRLAATVREVDLVARPGGDEFAVVCADLMAGHDGDLLARRLAAALQAPLTVDGAEVHLSASIGVTVADGTQSADALLADADVAMFAAKRSPGVPYASFDASMREDAQERVRTEEDLRAALRDGDLRVYYQPIADARDGRLAGMEALVRWEHPQRGLVSPAAFIPVAEESGLIVDVGRWVLGEATAQLARWRAAGVVGDGVGVTVNVSARQLADDSLTADVAAALAASGLDEQPGLVGLELTESMLMSAPDAASARLAELGRLGVRLLLDDFGTGASSLARLRRLPFDTLKIDRAFVSGLGQGDGEDDAVVAAIVALAGALGLDVVAEGVETAAQHERLRALGAGKLQGYLFSRPLPA
ncbi:MAG TPA: EAL domain-containing protein, partial [Capillimicrobium sp.]